MPNREVRTGNRAMGILSVLIALTVLAALGLVCAIVIRDRAVPTDAAVQPSDGAFVEADATPDADIVLKAESYVEPVVIRVTPVPGLTATPEPTPTVKPTLDASDPYARLRPMPQGENLLPVFSKAFTDTPVIAITLDECSGAAITGQFLDLAEECGARLTLFPTGENIMKEGMADVLRRCVFQLGFEVENRGYSTIARLYKCIDPMLVQEVWKQSVALNFVLGVKYEPHFFRVYGGVGEYDARTHAYLKQQGYLGIAHWTYSSAQFTRKTAAGKLSPGAIYSFRSNKDDLAVMRALMEAAQSEGYRMVTLNELFAYEGNRYYPVEGSLLAATMPTFSYDVTNFTDLFPGDASWAVYNMQQRLSKLGYMLENDVDGVYGEGTSDALRLFQAQVGRPASGAGDVGTLKLLYAQDAPTSPVKLVTPTPGPGELWEEGELIPSE